MSACSAGHTRISSFYIFATACKCALQDAPLPLIKPLPRRYATLDQMCNRRWKPVRLRRRCGPGWPAGETFLLRGRTSAPRPSYIRPPASARGNGQGRRDRSIAEATTLSHRWLALLVDHEASYRCDRRLTAQSDGRHARIQQFAPWPSGRICFRWYCRVRRWAGVTDLVTGISSSR